MVWLPSRAFASSLVPCTQRMLLLISRDSNAPLLEL
jgi:hypothetical protein